MVFCHLVVGVVWSTARKVLFHRDMCKHMLLVQCLCSHIHPQFFLSGSLLFLPLYFGRKKITVFAKRLHHHVIIIREARPFRNLILQEHFENSNQKTFMRNWRRQELVKKSFLKIWEFEKTNSNNLHEWERSIGPYFVVLPVLLAPSALCQSLPAGASSFFPCYFWIHLFQFPKDRT